MTASSPLADACPSCHPGDYPAVTPHTVTEGASIEAEYLHDVCGTKWRCWWDPDATGWPATDVETLGKDAA